MAITLVAAVRKPAPSGLAEIVARVTITWIWVTLVAGALGFLAVYVLLDRMF